MRTVTLLIVLTTPLLAQAEIYKTIDKNGNVVFTDTPTQGAQAVDEKPIMTMPALPQQVIKDSRKTGEDKNGKSVGNEPKAYKIKIGRPLANETIQHGTEKFKADLTLEPSLWSLHHLEIQLDGKPLPRDSLHPEIDPGALDRGQHRLAVQVVDAKKKVLSEASVDFFVQQPSQLLRKPSK